MNFRAESPARRRGAVVMDVTALVDVVFQLLIFFLLTSSYVSQRQAPSIDVDLPEASADAAAREMKDFTVVVKRDGTLIVGADERVTLEELGVRLRKTALEAPDTIVLIRADRDVPYRYVAEVMGQANSARLRVSAAVRAGGR